MMGRPSPRKDRDTLKAEQVSWLAAWLTLCAFPSRLWRDSGPCRFQRRSQLRGSNGFSLRTRGRGRRDHHFPSGIPSPGPLSLAYSVVLAGPPVHERKSLPESGSRDFYSNPPEKSRLFLAATHRGCGLSEQTSEIQAPACQGGGTDGLS